MNERSVSVVSFQRLEKTPTSTIVGLLSTSLSNEGVVRKSIPYWEWKHQINPFGSSTGFAAVDESGEAVSVRPMMMWMLRDGQRIIRCARPVDTATHHRWRGRGLFSELTRRTLALLPDRDVEMIFNTPNGQSLPGYIKLGWRVSGSVEMLFRPSVVGALRCLAASSGMHCDLTPAKAESIRSLAADRCREVLTFCALSEEQRLHGGLRSLRSYAFLQWRYVEHPNCDYQVMVLRDSRGAISGVAFLRTASIKGISMTIVSDIFATHDDGARSLIRKCVQSNRSAGVLVGACEGSFEMKALRRLGFFRLRSLPIVTNATVNKDEGVSRWGLSFGDLETF